MGKVLPTKVEELEAVVANNRAMLEKLEKMTETLLAVIRAYNAANHE